MTAIFIKVLKVIVCVLIFESVVTNGFAADYQVDLDGAIKIALSNNRRRNVSQQEIALAEAQYQQALSSFWPSVNFSANFQRLDEDPVFSVPASQLAVPTAAGTLNLSVPETKTKLLDRDIAIYALNIQYPLFTGGKRTAMAHQASIGIELASEAARKTDLQIIHDVTRFYYAAVMTELLIQIANSTVNELEVIRDVTQAFYKGGSASTNKRDYLQTEVTLSVARSIAARFESNKKSAISALGHSMGLDWESDIALNKIKFPDSQTHAALAKLIDDAKRFNPDIETLRLSIAATDSAIDEARSDYYPTIAIYSSIRHIENSIQSGLVGSENRDGWTIGLSFNLPLFDGFRTKSGVSAANIKHQRAKAQAVLLEQSIAFQIKAIFQTIEGALQQVKHSAKAADAAVQHSDLTHRMYQAGSLDTEDIIQALFLESLINANLIKEQHHLALALTNLEFMLGRQIEQ